MCTVFEAIFFSIISKAFQGAFAPPPPSLNAPYTHISDILSCVDHLIVAAGFLFATLSLFKFNEPFK